MQIFSPLDWTAIVVFLASWAGYAWLVDFSPWRDRTLSAAMDGHRRRWMDMLVRRDLRMVDTAIVAGLQNGTAFFASTSLLAIGAAFALFTTSDQVRGLLQDLPFGLSSSRPAWEVKALGLLAIYAYAFFKFGWSYRLFNYTSILIGAIPPASEREREETQRAAERAARMGILAGRHFTLGQRAFFFSVGFLGWFASAWLFLVITIAVLVALCRRQFSMPVLPLLQ